MLARIPFAAFALPAAFVLAALGAGLLVRRILTKRLEHLDAAATRTRLFLQVARGSVLPWFVTLGLYVAVKAGDVPPRIESVISRALLVALIASIAWMLSRLAGGLVRSHAAVGALSSATVVTNLARASVLLLGLLVILQTLGISITPMITALGIGGIAVALALQDTLANLFGGVHILASRQVRTGDYVRLDSGQEGYVKDVNWRFTTIHQPGSGILLVPNSKLAAAITTNFMRPDRSVSVSVPVSVVYGANLDLVERVTTEVALEVTRQVAAAQKGSSPTVRFQKLGSAVEFTAELTARDVASRDVVKHEFIKRLHRRFDEEGIQVPAAPAAKNENVAAGGRG